MKISFPGSSFLGKRGLSHVDWAMSLGIFIIYLSLFFILVKPLVMPSRNIDSAMDSLQENFIADTQSVVQKVPVFVSSTISRPSELVILDFLYSDWNTSEIAASTDYFAVDEGKLFLLMNTSDSKKAMLYYPFFKRIVNKKPFLSADQNRVQYGDFVVGFDDEVLDTIVYEGIVRVTGVSHLVDGDEIHSGGSFSKTDIFAKYRVRDHINISVYVPADNTRVYTYFVSDEPAKLNLTFSSVVYNYSWYYIDSLDNGKVTFPLIDACKDYESDFIDFNDGSTGVAFITSNVTLMHVCRNSTNIMISFDLLASKQDSFYYIFVHDGDHSAVRGYPIDSFFGVRDEFKGISASKVSNLGVYDYSQLKTLLKFPEQRDFNISVVSPGVNATFGKIPPERINVYARRSASTFALDKDLNTPIGTVYFTVW